MEVIFFGEKGLEEANGGREGEGKGMRSKKMERMKKRKKKKGELIRHKDF